MPSTAQNDASAPRSLARRLFVRVVENPAVFYYLRTHFYWGTMRRLRRTLDMQPGERLLDVGCGSGMGAGLTRGTYVGIDTEMTYLKFARNRLRGQERYTFMAMSVLDLAFRDASFDKAMMLNVVHHLDDAMADRFLGKLARVVRKKVYVLDHDIERDNAVSGWLVRQDRGEHMRPFNALRDVLAQHYEVDNAQRFFNAEHTVSCVVFTLTPRR
jgi:ubiquinone/menaquinone biosynthesis C-methylase UbiE